MYRILLLLTSFIVFSCTTNNGYTLEVEAVGFADNAQFYLQDLGENNQITTLDTLVVRNGKFTATYPTVTNKELHILSDAQGEGRVLFIAENGEMKGAIYKDSIASSQIKGTPENDLFYTYLANARERNTAKAKLNRELYQSRQEGDGIMVTELSQQMEALDKATADERVELIETNPNSLVSLLVLSDLINGKVITLEETETYFNDLTETIKNTSMGVSIKKFIAQSKSQNIAAGLASIGNKAPAFSGPTPEGKELALKETLGKYTIIDFWASWCRPCRAENPNVVRVYNKYHDKGLNIVSVSLDRKGQSDRWKRAIETDEMDWYHISNLQFWDDPIARSYGVRAIPATFLLDENGVIIAKNLRGDALEERIAQLLGDS